MAKSWAASADNLLAALNETTNVTFYALTSSGGSYYYETKSITAQANQWEIVDGYDYPTLISNPEKLDSGELICIPSS